MGERQGLIRNTVRGIITNPGTILAQDLANELFYNHINKIIMAINWKAVKGMTLAELLEYQEFKDQFIYMYDCHKGQDYYIGGEAFYKQEIAFMLALFRENPKLGNSTVISIATAMISGVAYHALSIEPVSKGLGYLIPTPVNLGNKDNPNWIDTCKFRISAYGELELRRRSGVIKSAKNPIMVYEGDIFETALKTVNGRSKMEIVQHIPKRKSEKITHAYIILTLPGGDEDIKIFSMEEIQGFRKMNRNEAMRNSPMWTGGFGGQPLRGTIEAKVIKHSFSTYPRINVGVSGASLETDAIDNGEDSYTRQIDRDTTLANVMGGAPEDDAPDYQDDQGDQGDDLSGFTADDDDTPPPPPTPPVTKAKAVDPTDF